MKRILAITLTACIAFALTSCNKADDSSSHSTSSSASLPNSESQSASHSQSASSSTSQSSSSQSSSLSETEVDSSQWAMSFVNTTASDGTEVLIEALYPLNMSPNWSFDGYSTYYEGEKKVMEVMYAEKIADKSDPYNIPQTEQFTATEGDEGFGYIESQEITLPTTKALLHLRKDYPHDSETPVYPHIYLVQKGDYIIVVNFTAYDENCQHLHKIYDEILDKIEIFI